MSTAIIFDALTHSRRLQEVDVPVKQANTHAELMTDFASKQSTYLATKADLKELDMRIEKLDMKIDKVDSKVEGMQWKLNAMLGLFSAFIALFGTFITYTQYVSQKSTQNSLPPTVKASTFKVG